MFNQLIKFLSPNQGFFKELNQKMNIINFNKNYNYLYSEIVRRNKHPFKFSI